MVSTLLHNNPLGTSFVETQQGSELNEDQRNILLSIIAELQTDRRTTNASH